MKAEVVTITPADAANLLQSNTINRNLVRRRVAALADAMRNNQWIADGSPIRRTPSGQLIDGQHRLAAVVEAGINVDMLVVSDIELDAQLVVDTNRPRSFNDYLVINNVPNARALSASTRFLWNYQHGIFSWKGDFKLRPYPSMVELWHLFQQRAETLRDGEDQSQAVIKYVRVSRSALAGMWVVLSDIDYEDASEFYDYLSMRTNQPIIDAAAVFIRMMNNQESRKFGGRRTQREQTALLIKAWNFYRKGQPVSVLGWRPGGKSPEPFPVPE